MNTDPKGYPMSSTAHTDIIRRIYLRGGRMVIHAPKYGDPLYPYRVRFVGHIIRGTWHRRYQ